MDKRTETSSKLHSCKWGWLKLLLVIATHRDRLIRRLIRSLSMTNRWVFTVCIRDFFSFNPGDHLLFCVDQRLFSGNQWIFIDDQWKYEMTQWLITKASCGMGLGRLCPIPPVQGRVDRVVRQSRNRGEWWLLRACLHQQHPPPRVVTQPLGYHRSRHTRAHDDEIEPAW